MSKFEYFQLKIMQMFSHCLFLNVHHSVLLKMERYLGKKRKEKEKIIQEPKGCSFLMLNLSVGLFFTIEIKHSDQKQLEKEKV